jgi:hypothetical protein
VIKGVEDQLVQLDLLAHQGREEKQVLLGPQVLLVKVVLQVELEQQVSLDLQGAEDRLVHKVQLDQLEVLDHRVQGEKLDSQG